MIRRLIARLLLALAESCDPELVTARRQYEAEKKGALDKIAFQESQVIALTEEIEALTQERNDALATLTQLKAATARVSDQIGTDHTGGAADSDVLRADLFGSGSGKTS